MSTKPSKSSHISKARKISSKSFANAWSGLGSHTITLGDQKRRLRFAFGAFLVAAALVAITTGLATYTKPGSLDSKDANNSATKSGDTQASLLLKPLIHAQSDPNRVLTVSVYENSLAEPVNTVQGLVRYPADKLKLISVKTATAFPQEAATDTATAGQIRFARAILAQSTPQTGERQVVILEFKAIKRVDVASELTIDWGQSYLVRSTDNQNILGQSTSSMQVRR